MTKHPTLAISLIIPVHNEAGAIADTLRQAHAALTEVGCPFEIIVVDDGSTDGSVAALEESGVEAQLLRHSDNRGYGATLKTGFAAARYDWLAFVDADGSYPLSDLPRLIELTAEADMVVGERTEYDRHASYGRRLGKAILVPLANYLTGERIPDLNSGMRVVRKRLVERYWPLLPDGFSLTTTLTMAFLSAGWRVRWEPISFHKRQGRSKIRPLRDMRNFLILILRTVTYFHPLKVYLPASLIFILASIAVVVVSKTVSGRVMDITSLFLFMAGLQLLLIGVLADLVLKILGTRE
ncbi:glycosyltransferase family 2 protein [bacterium]|nr:glycosyltransferase family 2 protein [bacterium]